MYKRQLLVLARPGATREIEEIPTGLDPIRPIPTDPFDMDQTTYRVTSTREELARPAGSPSGSGPLIDSFCTMRTIFWY